MIRAMNESTKFLMVFVGFISFIALVSGFVATEYRSVKNSIGEIDKLRDELSDIKNEFQSKYILDESRIEQIVEKITSKAPSINAADSVIDSGGDVLPSRISDSADWSLLRAITNGILGCWIEGYSSRVTPDNKAGVTVLSLGQWGSSNEFFQVHSPGELQEGTFIFLNVLGNEYAFVAASPHKANLRDASPPTTKRLIGALGEADEVAITGKYSDGTSMSRVIDLRGFDGAYDSLKRAKNCPASL